MLETLRETVLGNDRRMRRGLVLTLVSTLVYGICLIAQWIAVWMHLAPLWAGVLVTAFAVIGETGFYVLIRTGLSARFGEGSLNLPQMVFGIVSLAIAFVVNPHFKIILMMIVALVLQYGAFELSPRRCRQLSWFAVAVFVPIMVLFAWFDPHKYPPRIGGFQIAFTIAVLPTVGFVAGALSRLRLDLREQRRALRAALDRAETMAVTDELTGLPNRRYALQWTHEAITRAERSGGALCLAILDLDHFKRINDTSGHATGDAVLQQFAATITAILRSGTLFARWGGEEFLLVMPDMNLPTADTLLSRLRAQLAQPDIWASIHLDPVTVSAGLTNYRTGETIDAALRRADLAMYQAKQAGRDRHVTIACDTRSTAPPTEGVI